MMPKRWISILVGVCGTALFCMIVVLFITGKPIQEPFVPPAFDSNAIRGVPIVPKEMGFQVLDTDAFLVGICGTFKPKDNQADIWLTNPADNGIWLKIRILDVSGNVLGESGLLKPGEYVQTITLESVPPIGTPIVLKIMAYEPETYYSAGAITLSTTVMGKAST